MTGEIFSIGAAKDAIPGKPAKRTRAVPAMKHMGENGKQKRFMAAG
jgi:hypothetical protein